MKGFEHYQGRFHDGVENFLAAKEKGEDLGIRVSLRELLNPKRNSAKRVRALLNLVDRLAPGLLFDKKKYQDRYFKEGKFPFDQDNYQFDRDFIGKGGGKLCFCPSFSGEE